MAELLALIEQMKADSAQREKQFKEEMERRDREMERRERQYKEEKQALMDTLARIGTSSNSTLRSSDSNLKMSSDFQDVSNQLEKFLYNPEEFLTFDKWYKRAETVFASDKGKSISESDRTAIVRSKLQLDEYSQFESHILPKNPHELSLAETVEHLTKLFGRKESLFARRFRAWQTKIKLDESFLALAARIKRIGEDADFNSFKKEDLLTQLFVQALDGPHLATIRKKLLERTDEYQAKLDVARDPSSVPGLTIDSLAELAQRYAEVDKVNKSVDTAYANNQCVSTVNKGKAQKRRPPGNCHHCGAFHWHPDCPFKDSTCPSCKGKGHKEGFCASSKQFLDRLANRRKPAAHEVKRKGKFARKYIKPLINGVQVSLKHDTGADWTMISTDNWIKIGSPNLLPAQSTATSASGGEVRVKGMFSATIEINEVFGIVDVYVSLDGLNLFGNDAMEALKLWDTPISAVCDSISDAHVTTLKKVSQDFPKLFSAGLGKCNRAKFSLNVKRDAKVPFIRARPVAYSARTTVEQEIHRLEQEGVISQINYADAAAPIVVVKKKNGKIRITADYSTGLNRALETYRYPLPTAESIFAQLSGMDTFSSIDCSSAYHQIELDDDAKRFMCINTHIGLFQVNRMQPGVKTASGNFQQILDTLLAGTGAFAYQDDIIVPGKGKKDHDVRLHSVLKRLEEAGFTLAIEKCTFAQPQIKFLGRIVDKEGLRPDPEKLLAVRNIPLPNDISQLRSYTGALNWYGTFIPQLKDIRGPLDEMLRKDEKFVWTQARKDAFNKTKQALHSNLALVHYDEKLPIIVAADASSYGIGATLLHRLPDGSLRPIAHAATSFNNAERNYSQVEREALALVYAVKKFHQYVYGKSFELQTDHKPLLKIFGSKSGIPVHTANRLRRYALTLMGYDFKVKHIDGENFAYADFLSRLIDSNVKPGAEDVVIACIRESTEDPVLEEPEANSSVDVIKSLPVTLEDLKQATSECEHLQKVIEYVKTNWPQKKGQINDAEAAEYFLLRYELCVVNECLYLRDVPIIPPSLRKRILEDLHDGHPGCTRMQALAREVCYWPGYGQQIQSFVQRCEGCAINAKSPKKEILHPWPKPERPWQRIHIDFAEITRGDFFFVAVDALTNWPEVVRMKSTTASKTVAVLEDMFARWGPCSTIVSDNGPQFISSTFKEFCVRNGIEHILTAPYHPQSNGRAERFVDIVKTGLSKMEGEGDTDEKLRCFLLNYRRTPSPVLGGKSPFELMTGRKMPSRLDTLLAPAARLYQDNQHAIKMSEQFNKHHGAVSRTFSPNEPIFYKLHRNNSWAWHAGTVIERVGAANYNVLIDGRCIKAHANQLKQRFVTGLDSIAPSPSDSFIDDFYLPQAPEAIVENQEQPPPEALDDDADISDDEFASAEENDDVPYADEDRDFELYPEVVQPELVQPAPVQPEFVQPAPVQPVFVPAPERPKRNYRPPAYLDDYERNLDNVIDTIIDSICANLKRRVRRNHVI
jgi:hypothetical protein